SAVVVTGIASAAVTPIPTIANNFAVAGQVIKSADLNKLAEAVNILDQRVPEAVKPDIVNTFNGYINQVNSYPNCTNATTRIYDIGTINANGGYKDFIEIEVIGSHQGYSPSYLEKKKFLLYVGGKVSSETIESVGMKNNVAMWDDETQTIGDYQIKTPAGKKVQIAVNENCGSTMIHSVNVRYSKTLNFTPSVTENGTLLPFTQLDSLKTINSPELHFLGTLSLNGSVTPRGKLDIGGLPKDFIITSGTVCPAGYTLKTDADTSGGPTVGDTCSSNNGLIVGNGNAGIGTALPSQKLEVAGAVKIATTTSACDTISAGTIRYEANKFEGCNGTAWVQLNN
ncbi:MAG: hypothetical protein WBP45_04120, partial [Daejeonella sp.]